jgi:hypothetical protein
MSRVPPQVVKSSGILGLRLEVISLQDQSSLLIAANKSPDGTVRLLPGVDYCSGKGGWLLGYQSFAMHKKVSGVIIK